MGYAATTCLVYGIKINQSQAERLEAKLRDLFVAGGHGSTDDFDGDPQGSVDALGLAGLGMLGPDADSRVHRCSWVEDRCDYSGPYTCGFELGSNGYGASDNLVALIRKGPSAATLAQWKKLAPILASIRLRGAPDMETVAQIH